MIVSGGAYHERVLGTGHVTELGGSALRAAAALPSTTSLVVAADTSQAESLAGVGATLSFQVELTERGRPVEFAYLAEFVEPTLRGRDASYPTPMHVSGDAVLAFGMVETGERTIDAKTLVYDPQSVDDPAASVLASATFDRAALCANALEIRAFGEGASLPDAAADALRRLGVDVVVVKAGALGCLVTTRESQEWIGAVPTGEVRKLGSGDVFSGSFAHAWASGADPVDAARIASHATSWWVEHELNRIPDQVLTPAYSAGRRAHEVETGRRPRIYLAGPFFTVAELWLVQQCRVFLEQAGAEVFSPFDEVGKGGIEVAEKDLAGLADVDAVFAILDGWDPGTLFEAGWAKHASIPTVGAATNLDPLHTTMLAGTGAELYTNFTTAMYRTIWRGLGAPPRGGSE